MALREARVRVPSEKMSLGMGRRPCSKVSRRGRRRRWRGAEEVEEGCGSGGSASMFVCSMDEGDRREWGGGLIGSEDESVRRSSEEDRPLERETIAWTECVFTSVQLQSIHPLSHPGLLSPPSN